MTIRDVLVDALKADLIGPYRPSKEGEPPAEEVLPLPPSRWYLTGFLAPQGAREIEESQDEEMGVGSDTDADDSEHQEHDPKRRKFLAASMGMSVLIPPGPTTEVIRATVSYAEYLPELRKIEGRTTPKRVWRREPREPITKEVQLDPVVVAKGLELIKGSGLWLRGKLETIGGSLPGLDDHTRSLALFVVNERDPGDKTVADDRFVFQIQLELEFTRGFVARSNRKDAESMEWDDRVADLQFRDRCEYAVGHGISVETPKQSSPVTKVRTNWIPQAEVRRVITHVEEGVATEMERLATLSDGEQVHQALDTLVAGYGGWIETNRQIPFSSKDRRENRDELMKEAERVKVRIAEGIDLLARDAEALDAFKLMNRAMADAALRRSPERYREGKRPEWHLFQLAFILLNLPSVVDPHHPDRPNVELIFFPTGGGKTEAYLGLIACGLILRRLRGRGRPDQGLGVAVLLRYTLRLLTLDQLGRAATMICALELLRKKDPDRLGTERFAAGLWVGRSATANTLRALAAEVNDYKSGKTKSSPFPLPTCPWCGERLGPDSFDLRPNKTKPEEIIIGCLNPKPPDRGGCPFTANNNPGDGVPVVFVDEQIYRELPCFIVATVDKFAMMPWRGETAMLFGRATSRQGRRFYGPLDKKSAGGGNWSGTKLPEGLCPPEMIVQDELHLISGPLGTMVGLYETAIDSLCQRTDSEGRRIVPKIVASTATVRRAQRQIQSLFGRPDMTLFPPPGIDDSETYFAKVDHDSPGRLYLGVAAFGRAMKAILLRVYVNQLTAAQKLYGPKRESPNEPADGYMTLVGYFNSLRELGGMRRLTDDEVRSRCAKWAERRPEDDPEPSPWFLLRDKLREPVELTSREPTPRIAESKARLAKPYNDTESVDVVLASNMISVGVDIDRLGLMVVAGQPKSTSEYIQATSRVGRDLRWPGLVVTCLNVHKPRDRSHYERFTTFHESIYRFVESQSLTPFSGPALERGLAGTLVAMTRLSQGELTPSAGAMAFPAHRAEAEELLEGLARRGGAQPGVHEGDTEFVMKELRQRGKNLLDAWEQLVSDAKEGSGVRHYSNFDLEQPGKRILYTVLDQDRPNEGTDEAKFSAPTSMRDVEPTVHLWHEDWYK